MSHSNRSTWVLSWSVIVPIPSAKSMSTTPHEVAFSRFSQRTGPEK